MTSQWVEKLHFTLQIRHNVRARFLTNTCSAWGSSELMKSDHGLTSEGARKAGVEPTPPKCNLKTISLFPWCSLYSLSLLDGSRQWLRKILFWPESRSTQGILLIAVLKILALFSFFFIVALLSLHLCLFWIIEVLIADTISSLIKILIAKSKLHTEPILILRSKDSRGIIYNNRRLPKYWISSSQRHLIFLMTSSFCLFVLHYVRHDLFTRGTHPF